MPCWYFIWQAPGACSLMRAEICTGRVQLGRAVRVCLLLCLLVFVHVCVFSYKYCWFELSVWSPASRSDNPPVLTVHVEVIVSWCICWWHCYDSVWFSAYRLSPTYNMDKIQVNSNSLLFTFLAGAAMETKNKHYHGLKRMNTDDPNKCQCYPFCRTEYLSQTRLFCFTFNMTMQME